MKPKITQDRDRKTWTVEVPFYGFALRGSHLFTGLPSHRACVVYLKRIRKL